MLRTTLALTILVLLLTCSAASQTREQSPSDLIRFLTYQSDDRPEKMLALAGTLGCGQTPENRAAALSLAKLGDSALPDIEKAIGSIERLDRRSDFALNSEWLLLAYARIKGQNALPRLQKLIGNPRVVFLQLHLDHAIALALGLTSYASSFHRLPGNFHCSRPEEPRDALDKLINTWERNDRSGLQASLGPLAKTALTLLTGKKTWEGLRAELWPRKSGGSAVGYRIDIPGIWSEPEETLENDRGGTPPRALSPELDTIFKDSLGGDCGKHRVKFSQTEIGTTVGQGSVGMYQVNNSDLEDLLRVIAFCATNLPTPSMSNRSSKL